jgi:hypothetical protein
VVSSGVWLESLSCLMHTWPVYLNVMTCQTHIITYQTHISRCQTRVLMCQTRVLMCINVLNTCNDMPNAWIHILITIMHIHSMTYLIFNSSQDSLNHVILYNITWYFKTSVIILTHNEQAFHVTSVNSFAMPLQIAQSPYSIQSLWHVM